MKTGKKLSIISKYIFFIFTFLLSSISCFAVDNALSGIDVKQIGENDYKVLLKLDKKVQIKKSFNGENNMALILSSTLPSDSLEIVYDNAKDLNNIIVQKKNSDNTLILMNGKNIKNSKIYIKDLSTGSVKSIDTNDNLLNELFFIADKKVFVCSVLGMIFLFFIMLALRPKEKRYHTTAVKKTVKERKQYAVNTLRKKNLVQSGNIPSISYVNNGKFTFANTYMSRPESLTSDSQYEEEEKIRKAG